MSDHVQTRSFAGLLASKLAEQNIHLDSAHLPADVSGADVWLVDRASSTPGRK